MGMNELHIKLILVDSLIFICDITLFQMNWVEKNVALNLKPEGYLKYKYKKFLF